MGNRMSINTARIKAALPIESGAGRHSIIRQRPDVVEIVLDCVLRRRRFIDIADRCGVDVESVNRFRRKFITDEVEKICLVEAKQADSGLLDEQVNEAQDGIEGGIHGILKEQKRLYATLNKRLTDGERDIEDLLPGLTQLLRDQTRSYESLLKVFSTLKEKNTIVLSLNEHPDVAKLMDVLWVLFQEQPSAFARFQELIAEKRIPLDVQ
ncbi:MAG: hypothetical protein ABJ251_07040 [Paracoccaceae bacterium]